MNRIAGRAWALLLIVAVLLGGIGFFIYEYVTLSQKWAMHTGNPHVYEDPAAPIPVVKGTVVDRNGNFLLHIGDKRTYSEDASFRASTLHWIGDRAGNISVPLLKYYTNQMLDYDPINGVYQYGDQGGKMTLTLDATVQAAALQAMGSRKGTVAVYNYKTGELICAVTTPCYDPENVPDWSADTEHYYEGVYLNRFMQSAYIPGSIFKLVTSAAALETVPDILDQTFVCTGTYSFGPDKVTCEIAHGVVDLKKAMQRSCNCAYAQIAQLIGSEKLALYVQQYGVTKPVSFDGMVSVKGNFDVENAAAVELAWSAIGQHKDQINPCAFLTFIGAIANGGQGVKPYIVDKVSVGDKSTYQAGINQMDRIMPQEVADILRAYMRNNVVNNYGEERFHGLTVCAKTGTGQVDGDQKPNATFVGFVTDEEYPLAFVVMVENAGYGKAVCIPIISKVLEACIPVMDGK